MIMLFIFFVSVWQGMLELVYELQALPTNFT